jgi:hypothetical protein
LWEDFCPLAGAAISLHKSEEPQRMLIESAEISLLVLGPKALLLTQLAQETRKRSMEQLVRSLCRKFIVQLGFHNMSKTTKRIGKGRPCVYNAVHLGTGREVGVKSFKKATYFAVGL